MSELIYTLQHSSDIDTIFILILEMRKQVTILLRSYNLQVLDPGCESRFSGLRTNAINHYTILPLKLGMWRISLVQK